MDDMNYQPRYADFGIRLGAALLDGLIIIIPIVFIFTFLLSPVLESFKDGNPRPSDGFIFGGLMIYFLGIPLLGLLYRTVFESSKYQGTPGKMIVGIIVVDANLERVSFWRALGRNIAKPISSMIFYIGYFMILGSSKCQALHDQIASTYVIRK